MKQFGDFIKACPMMDNITLQLDTHCDITTTYYYDSYPSQRCLKTVTVSSQEFRIHKARVCFLLY